MKKVNTKYGDTFSSLDIEVGFAKFLRALMAYEAQITMSTHELKQILPNTSTNESLRLFLLNLEDNNG